MQGGAAHDGVGVQQSTAPEAPLHSGRKEQVDGHLVRVWGSEVGGNGLAYRVRVIGLGPSG